VHRGQGPNRKRTSSNSTKEGPVMAPLRDAKRPLLSAPVSSLRCLIALEEEAQVRVADEHGVRDNLHERSLKARATILHEIGSETTCEIDGEGQLGAKSGERSRD
jgi:hypothetical protein